MGKGRVTSTSVGSSSGSGSGGDAGSGTGDGTSGETSSSGNRVSHSRSSSSPSSSGHGSSQPSNVPVQTRPTVPRQSVPKRVVSPPPTQQVVPQQLKLPPPKEEATSTKRAVSYGQPSVVAKIKKSSADTKKKEWSGFAFSKVPLILFALLIIALIGIAWYKMEHSKKGAVRTRLDTDGIVEPEHVALAAPELRVIAKKAKVQRDWFKALRYLWASTLVDLEASGRLRIHPAATNLELVSALRGSAKAQALFGFLAGTFDLHFYGRLEVNEEDYRECEEAASRLRQVLDLDNTHMTDMDKQSRIRRVMTAGKVAKP